ncbi:winged helix-turn-helix domain-containing protein, partial [Actinoallomurus spadix]|uniref:winged helix-turn-helix domain-containing protein n=1 Tax=Actinoallomurus spadix TaxID=79912 RepID=UPI0031D214AC
IDLAAGGEVRRNGEQVRLTRLERKMLMFFANNHGLRVSRDKINQAVWGDRPIREFSAALRALRKKIKDVPGESQLIIPVNTDKGPVWRFGPRELGASETAVKWVQVEDLKIDVVGGEVRKDKKPIELSEMQWKLLQHLARNPGNWVTKADLIQAVWGRNIDGKTLYKAHRGLLKRIGDDPRNPRLIVAREIDGRTEFRLISAGESGDAPSSFAVRQDSPGSGSAVPGLDGVDFGGVGGSLDLGGPQWDDSYDDMDLSTPDLDAGSETPVPGVATAPGGAVEGMARTPDVPVGQAVSVVSAAAMGVFKRVGR